MRVGIAEWWARTRAGVVSGWDGTSGTPRSPNGASSFHLFWQVPSRSWVQAEAVLEVLEAPAVARLYFWALQVSFHEQGRSGGGAHLGLQWFPPHPGSTALNWGGYGPDGAELEGTSSSLPSTPGNPNTRDFAWVPGRRYRLRIRPGDGPAPSGLHPWRGEVVDETTGALTVVRELWARGDRIEAPMTWSEVFADCDDVGVVVRWSECVLTAADGTRLAVDTVTVNYQSLADGGCVTTDSSADELGFVQATGTVRRTPNGRRLRHPA